MKKTMSKLILYIGTPLDTIWPDVLRTALSPWGEVEMITDMGALEKLEQRDRDLIVVDAVATEKTVSLVNTLHKSSPQTPIVVVTTSPTWNRAREFLHAGATDYIRKSLDSEILNKIFKNLLFVIW